MKLAALKSFQSRNNVTISCLPYTIGRCRSADFIIAHVNVSRNHCEIVKENGLWKIKDYSSSGTFVNGFLVGKGKSEILNDGDSIRFGPLESNLSWSFYSYDSSNGNSNDSDISRALDWRKEEYAEADRNSPGQKPFETNNLSRDSFDSKFTRFKSEMEVEQANQNKKACKITNERQNLNNSSSLLPMEGCYKESSEGEKIQDSSKELQQVQHTSISIGEKKSILQENLVAGNLRKTEVIVGSNLLENLTDVMEAEFQCTICSELFVVAITLSCTHTFCKYCINQWKKKQKTCPICRKKITNETRSLVVDNYIDKMVGNLSLELKKRREAIIKERSNNEPCKKRSKIKSKPL